MKRRLSSESIETLERKMLPHMPVAVGLGRSAPSQPGLSRAVRAKRVIAGRLRPSVPPCPPRRMPACLLPAPSSLRPCVPSCLRAFVPACLRASPWLRCFVATSSAAADRFFASQRRWPTTVSQLLTMLAICTRSRQRAVFCHAPAAPHMATGGTGLRASVPACLRACFPPLRHFVASSLRRHVVTLLPCHLVTFLRCRVVTSPSPVPSIPESLNPFACLPTFPRVKRSRMSPSSAVIGNSIKTAPHTLDTVDTLRSTPAPSRTLSDDRDAP